MRKTDRGFILLLLYVDDMIITGDDLTGISDLKQSLNDHFKMKDLGTLSYFLGLEILSTSDGHYVSQAKYASDLLSRAGITDSKIATTPLEPNVKLTPTDGTPLLMPPFYRQLVDSLVYLTVTRPDIAHAVHIVGQFMTAPRSTHYAAILRLLRYIKGTMFMVYTFQLIPCCNYMLIRMPIGPAILLIIAPPLAFASSWVIHSSLGEVRNKRSLLDPVLMLNIVLLLMLHRNFSGYDVYLEIWASHTPDQLLSVVITEVPYRSPITAFFMNAPNISRLIATSFVNILLVE